MSKKLEIVYSSDLKKDILYQCSACGYHQYAGLSWMKKCRGCGNTKWTYTDGWVSLTKEEFVRDVKKHPKNYGIKLKTLLKVLP